ncbi:hypothetical protein [Herbaspirillum chlorophenolicum]|nr:hypothetical protein [Herbaspirillum chlorophenolicum]
MRMSTLAVAIAMMLALSACERKGVNPPKPVTSMQAMPASG